ncbi:hypothetical protein MO973_01320 [Paenibacillus sp. TRM 82003]|nr:hypothetical protein [Paenibacillus sp. TRM 82003]
MVGAAGKFQESLERHGTETHLKQALKHGLLAYRSVIDSVLDAVEEEEKAPPAARKITISKE